MQATITDLLADRHARVQAAAAFLRERGAGAADVAIVLGSGLGAFGDGLAGATRVVYGDIPHWPASGIIGHAGVLVAGELQGRRVLTLSGRAHFYEGHDLATVTFAMRVLGALG